MHLLKGKMQLEISIYTSINASRTSNQIGFEMNIYNEINHLVQEAK